MDNSNPNPPNNPLDPPVGPVNPSPAPPQDTNSYIAPNPFLSNPTPPTSESQPSEPFISIPQQPEPTNQFNPFSEPTTKPLNNDINPTTTEPAMQTGTSPLDNPLNMPPQPIPTVEANWSELTNSSSFPAQTEILNQPLTTNATTTIFPNPIAPSTETFPENSPIQAVDNAPTDLSHLISDTSPQPNGNSVYTPSLSQSETLIVPTPPSPDSVQVTTAGNGNPGLPKWVIGLGIGLLIIVAGTSAYFILGVGQNRPTTSLPATQTGTVKQAPPIATPNPTATPSGTEQTATGSANFGVLDSSQPTSSPSSTSAADLLRQRRAK